MIDNCLHDEEKKNTKQYKTCIFRLLTHNYLYTFIIPKKKLDRIYLYKWVTLYL